MTDTLPYRAEVSPFSETQGQIVGGGGWGGGEGKSKRAEINNTKKIKERGEEPLWL